MPSADRTAEPAAAPEPAAPAAPEALEVTGIEVREGAPGARVEITSSEPLVWTSFRDTEGRVVVELPNALQGSGVSDVVPDDGLVESVTVSQEQPGRRPLTRLVIATREEVEHTLRADGTRLTIELEPLTSAGGAAELPAAEESPEIAFEPVP
ncbi:MAG TPA: AMIN domain-containing protein, partial [Thermoanaerobaculia bacterium]